MKYIDLLYIVIVLAMISASLVRFGNQFIKMEERERALDTKKESLCFISNSFINTCRGKGFDSFEEWQKTCKALWPLDYIAWGDAASFLPVENNLCYYAKWTGLELNGEVFCRAGDVNAKK